MCGDSMDDKQLIEIAERGYGDSLPKSKEEALAHTSGDTLADFIVIELLEALYDGVIDYNEALFYMNRARDQLDGVVSALESYKGDDR